MPEGMYNLSEMNKFTLQLPWKYLKIYTARGYDLQLRNERARVKKLGSRVKRRLEALRKKNGRSEG